MQNNFEKYRDTIYTGDVRQRSIDLKGGHKLNVTETPPKYFVTFAEVTLNNGSVRCDENHTMFYDAGRCRLWSMVTKLTNGKLTCSEEMLILRIC
ncbi:hypothetical protein CSKR_110270, partial [Clonorchis sinensis]